MRDADDLEVARYGLLLLSQVPPSVTVLHTLGKVSPALSISWKVRC